jgi:hypothetical protein
VKSVASELFEAAPDYKTQRNEYIHGASWLDMQLVGVTYVSRLVINYSPRIFASWNAIRIEFRIFALPLLCSVELKLSLCLIKRPFVKMCRGVYVYIYTFLTSVPDGDARHLRAWDGLWPWKEPPGSHWKGVWVWESKHDSSVLQPIAWS